jgi:hypothetical protein
MAGVRTTRSERLVEEKWADLGPGPALISAFGAELLLAISDAEPVADAIGFMLRYDHPPLPVMTSSRLWARVSRRSPAGDRRASRFARRLARNCERFSMNPNTDFAAMLERAYAALQNRTASAGELKTAAEAARAAVSAIDEAMAAATQRERQVLARMTPPPESYLRSRSIAQTREALEALAGEDRTRMLDRKIAARFAADLDALARDAEAAEKARDEKRKPFLDQTRRARDYTQRVAEAPKLFKQVVSQFSADIVIAHLGKGAWSRTPRPQGVTSATT